MVDGRIDDLLCDSGPADQLRDNLDIGMGDDLAPVGEPWLARWEIR